MIPKFYQFLAFFYMKFVTGCLLYFFYQFIEHGDNTFIYTFLGFYLFERIISYIAIFSNLNPPFWESVLIGFLNPFQLDEFYLLCRGSKHPRYLSEGIDGQAFVISIISIPMYTLALLWTLNHQETINIVFTSFALVALTYGLFFIQYIAFFEHDQITDFNNKFFLFNIAKELVFSSLHYLTYVALICINFQIKYFGFQLMTAYIILIVAYIGSILQRVKSNNASLFSCFFVCVGMVLKEILHIVIDSRNFTIKLKRSSIQTHGFQVFNKMLLFAFTIKLYLFITFIILLYQQNQYENMKPFYVVLLIASILSLLILAARVFKHTIWPFISGPTYLEFEELQEVFEQYDKYEQNKEFYKNLEAIIVFYQSVRIVDLKLLSILLYGFSKSQFICQQDQRENNNNQYQEVRMYTSFSVDDISKVVLSQGKFLPQIELVYFTLVEHSSLQDLYQIIAKDNIQCRIITNLDNAHVQEANLNKQTVQNIKQTCLNYTVFQQTIQQELVTNPQLVFYDLFEQFDNLY